MRSSHLLLFATCALALTGCGQFGPKRTGVSLFNVPIGDAISASCGGGNAPTHFFEIDLAPTGNANLIATQIWQYDLDTSGHPGTKSHYDVVPAPGHVTTPWNLNLGLDSANRKKVGVIINLDGTSGWAFAASQTIGSNTVDMGVTSNEDSDRKPMFCDVKTTPTQTQFTVKYLHNPKGTEAKTFAFYSINLVVPLGGGVVIPMTLDPEVKNEG
jgi:hypothetical protein